MTRVLSTEAARTSIAKMATLINSGLAEQIGHLQAEGRNLSQPEVWDGVAAMNFRSIWEQAEAQLNATKQSLEDLRIQIAQVNASIMIAGGNQ